MSANNTNPAPITEVPLCSLPAGSRGRIVCPMAGRELRCRLCSMGLMPGLEVEILSNGSGPVILNVKGSRIIIGHGMATKILVRPVTGHAADQSGIITCCNMMSE